MLSHPGICGTAFAVISFQGLHCTAAVTFPVGANASSMAAVMALRSYSCRQAQSFLALLSSRTWGQLSATRDIHACQSYKVNGLQKP